MPAFVAGLIAGLVLGVISAALSLIRAKVTTAPQPPSTSSGT